jgi:undecaprenyl-diphosphatase
MSLNDFDLSIFYYVNHDLHFPLFREMTFWFPMYVFLFFRLIIQYKKQAFFLIIGIMISIALSDFITSGILKPLIARPRPCNDPSIAESVWLLCGCSGFSFASSHAANHFAIATFIGLIYNKQRWVSILLSFWASLISISQVYVGLHYPTDIFVGALIGIIVATTVFYITERYFLTTTT